MTDREKIAHLYRRFGFGATQAELNAAEKRGLHPTIDALIDYEKTDERFPISPWELLFRPNKQVNLDPQTAAAWWTLRMVLTKRPLQEKLTLFWHDHFAVSASKVENAPMMLKYLDTLRAGAAGNFRKLLGDMTKDAAMLRWLDTDTSVKGKPNENYAREVLELFTMGIGNYTEKDVQELARAFTGWGLRAVFRGGRQEELPARIAECVLADRPFVASAYSEDLHDEGPKTILGKTAPFETENVLDHIVSRPATAKYIVTKLWECFAYPKPEPRIVEKLAKVFMEAKYEVKPVLKAIATTPDFWSEECVRKQVKSPADFTIGILRQLELGETALKSRKPDAKWNTPLEGSALQLAQVATLTMRRLGMRLLYPPDVAGWDWGEAWVSPAMMSDRIRFADTLSGRAGGSAAFLRDRVFTRAPKSSAEAVAYLASVFDAEIPPERLAVLVEGFDKAGGVPALDKIQTGVNAVRSVVRLIFGMPEFQMC